MRWLGWVLFLVACSEGDPYHVDWAPHDVVMQIDGELRTWLPGGLSVKGDAASQGCLELQAMENTEGVIIKLNDTLRAITDFCVQTIPRVSVDLHMDHDTMVNQLQWNTILNKNGILNLCPTPSMAHIPCD